MSTIRTNLSITVIGDDGSPESGALPARVDSVATTSRLIYQSTQIVGTTHETLAAGDTTDAAMCAVRNTHPTATISIGVEVATVFYPLATIPPLATLFLPRLSSIAGTFLRSSAVSTDVLVSLYKIA